jgi:hypothetical protein
MPATNDVDASPWIDRLSARHARRANEHWCRLPVRASSCDHGPGDFIVLTVATLGLFGYGAYSTIWPLVELLRGARLELWAELGLMLFGLLLMLSAAFVRVRLPGGIALALGAMLGLQALAVHSAAHLASGVAPQIGRALIAGALLALAWAGSDAPNS